uniref:HAP1 N-terminal domain-containing protein n=1 Tax=Ditylenchus dipsaci TaxID=166011 RepID=A0A915DGK7_9BILA
MEGSTVSLSSPTSSIVKKRKPGPKASVFISSFCEGKCSECGYFPKDKLSASNAKRHLHNSHPHLPIFNEDPSNLLALYAATSSMSLCHIENPYLKVFSANLQVLAELCEEERVNAVWLDTTTLLSINNPPFSILKEMLVSPLQYLGGGRNIEFLCKERAKVHVIHLASLSVQCEDLPSTFSASGPQFEDGAISSVLHRLEEKEKDLELAAKIGNSLLEQNKELQERNEFLEESLHQSNENVVQLRHQLKQRSSLFYAIASLDDEEEEFNGSNSRTENSHTRTQHLETRLKSLENENRNLKGEASKLEDYNAALEKKERERVRDYLGQLEKANLKFPNISEALPNHCSATINNLAQELLPKHCSAIISQSSAIISQHNVAQQL